MRETAASRGDGQSSDAGGFPKLVSAGYKSQTPFDHSSYLATVEDILGLSRLVTTAGSTSMNEFFVRKTSP